MRKKQREFRDIININPVLLYKEDLFQLENKLIEDPETDEVEIKLEYNNETIPADSFKEFFSNTDLPTSTDNLSISMRRWTKTGDYKDIDSGVSISMNYNHVNCQIHSLDNTWFLGKKSQIESFFRTKSPWYSLIIFLYTSFPAMAILFLFYAAYLFTKNEFIFMVLPIVSFAILSVGSALIFNQKIFPYVRVNLFNKPKFEFGFNELCALIGALAGILTIIQIISNIF